jgi:hypothetical protein
MSIKEKQLGSIRTLLSVIDDLHETGYIYFFRGHANKSFKLLPSIYRKTEWLCNEDKMIREMLMRCPNDFSLMRTSFEKLVKMQHYDLPTRLLDLSENPLVALYFACASEQSKTFDGEFIIFKIPKAEVKYFDSDTVSIISNIAWSSSNFEIHQRYEDARYFHDDENHDGIKLMHDIQQEKPYFTPRIKPEHLQSVVCVKPKMDNQRVIRQDGAFLLFGVNKNKHVAATIPDDWVYRLDNKKYIIKASAKTELLKQLASIGISKAKLFPEIDMVSQFIKNDDRLEKIDFTSSHYKDAKPVGYN